MCSRVVVAAVLVAVLGPMAVGTAHADGTDDKFLADLRAEGITDHLRAHMRSRPATSCA